MQSNNNNNNEVKRKRALTKIVPVPQDGRLIKSKTARKKLMNAMRVVCIVPES